MTSQERPNPSEPATKERPDDESPFGPLIDTTMRVVSWNLWWRFGPWEARQEPIGATLEALAPDVVALQEVWADDEVEQAAVLADRLGFAHVYESRLDMEGTRFGNAVLSRWPISGSEWRPLPAPSDAEEFRTVVRADVEGPRGAFQVFSTHLHWRLDHSHIRQDQVRALTRFVAESPGRSYPAVVCGDFNADPDSDEIRMLVGKAAGPEPGLVFHDAWTSAGDGGPGITWSNDNPYARSGLEPDRRIDYVFVGWPKRGGAGHPVAAEVAGVDPVDGVHPSDHHAVVADLRY